LSDEWAGLAMPEIIDDVAMIWVAAIIAYATIAAALIAMRWVLRQIEHRKGGFGAEPHSH
jgi:hypothetical protein